jgi:NADH:ubiquinone oxidoreductase subunit 4 (subunit M)
MTPLYQINTVYFLPKRYQSVYIDIYHGCSNLPPLKQVCLALAVFASLSLPGAVNQAYLAHV